MVKYLALMVALVAPLVIVNLAEARGHRGCASCSAGGCPGGVCAVTVAPTKTAASEAPPVPVVSNVAGATPAVESAPRYATVSVRRGLFARRR